jgi:hypothetical protein
MYSRKRLIIIGCAWLVAGAVLFAVSPHFGVSADPRGCTGNCMFPAEANIGGIVLGASNLQAENLTTFGIRVDQYSDIDQTLTEPTPPGRPETEEKHIILGGNEIEAEDFIIYKSWNYFDDRVGQEVPMYIYADADSASISGSPDSACGSLEGPNQVKQISSNTNERNLDGIFNCDLTANVSEVSFGRLSAEVPISTSCTGNFCPFVGFLTPLSDTNYWSVNPEFDDCGLLTTLSSICLGAVEDGGSEFSVPVFGGANIYNARAEAWDFWIRGHSFKVIKGKREDTVNPNPSNKELSLNGAYFEARFGTGYDRVVKRTGEDTGVDGNNDPAWGDAVKDDFGYAGLKQSTSCRGGGVNTSCDIKDGRVQSVEGAGYGNPYLPEIPG